MQPVESSVLESVGHNGLRLRVRFKSGKTFDFDGAPISHYWQLLGAKSPGKYFGEHIKPKFRAVEVHREG